LSSFISIMYRSNSITRLLFSCCAATVVATSTHAADPAPADVASALKRSADWHLSNPSGIDTRDWIIAPLYDGLIRTSLATGNPKYLAEVVRFGTQSGWMAGNRKYHADDHAVGHAWIDIYQMDPSRKERLAPMKARIDDIIARPLDLVRRALHGTAHARPASHRHRRPQIPGVSSIANSVHLRSPLRSGGKLFFRDANFFEKKTPSGKKTFWSRGNGWVYGGLALMLEHLPKDHPKRGFYENLFKEMTTAILAAQQPDGLWHPSLLDLRRSPSAKPAAADSSPSAWHGASTTACSTAETHWPAITRGWTGLMTRVKPDGLVGYVQPVGAAPAHLGPESTQDYGTGAFLLAGSELSCPWRCFGRETRRWPCSPQRKNSSPNKRRSPAPMRASCRNARTTSHGKTTRSPSASMARRCVTSRRTAASTPGAKRFPIR
jgi:unsaturated rhamnogalacturonyl hydrolase